jgi:hypothetical protein
MKRKKSRKPRKPRPIKMIGDFKIWTEDFSSRGAAQIAEWFERVAEYQDFMGK